jgi:PTS system nitrogen regulatory IIA component
MELTRILRQEAIRSVGASSKKRAFQTLGEIMASVHGVEEAQVVAALREREGLGPTGVGNGVALPHARLDGVEAMTGCFLRLDRGVEFGSVDRQPVDLIFALFAPTGCGVEHLRALAAVSRVMRVQAVRSKLRSNTDPAVLHAILTELPATQAA